jgi:FixJ family two-component response regulator
VYLVDDEPVVARAVARLLRAAGLTTLSYESPERFLAEHDPFHPGCVVLDYSMPGTNGIEIQDRLRSDAGTPPRQVIFLTGRADIPTSVTAMRRGAVDFLTKPVDGEALIVAVRRALERDARCREEYAEGVEIRSRLAKLTPREREVLTLVASGMLNKQVAAELGTTEKTIKVHRARVMDKMRAGSLAELVRLADRVAERDDA